MSTIDYDTPRRSAVELDEDSLEELRTHRASAQSASVDIDEGEAADVYELPGADLSDEELTVTVVPMRSDEFRCSRCFLVHHRSQLAVAGSARDRERSERPRGVERAGQDVCRECA
jgi:hypothetical protein